MAKVRKLSLSKEQTVKVEASFQYKSQMVDDFNNALTNCATIELNKARVGGAEHSHWVELGLVTGEMIYAHLDSLDMLEKMIVENARLQQLDPANKEKAKA